MTGNNSPVVLQNVNIAMQHFSSSEVYNMRINYSRCACLVARQLKTINYSLSSEKCMDDGWTIKPETPEPPVEPAKQFFVQEPSGTDIGLLSGKVCIYD